MVNTLTQPKTLCSILAECDLRRLSRKACFGQPVVLERIVPDECSQLSQKSGHWETPPEAQYSTAMTSSMPWWKSQASRERFSLRLKLSNCRSDVADFNLVLIYTVELQIRACCRPVWWHPNVKDFRYRQKNVTISHIGFCTIHHATSNFVAHSVGAS